MKKHPHGAQNPAIEGVSERYALLEFFALTFIITWGLVLIFFRYPFHFLLRFGPIFLDQPFYRLIWHLCVYAPAISAFIVITRRHGFAGLWSYFRRVLRWKIHIKWYLIVLVGFPIFYAIDKAIFVAVGGSASPYPVDPWYLVIIPALFSVITNPAPVEEFGWRGFALPLLQRRFSALGSSLILGTIWGFWHFPAFLLIGPPYTLNLFPLYLIQAISLTIIMTALYNATGGNVLIAFLFHWQIHDPFQVDAFPDDLYVLTPMLVVAALAAIFLSGLWKPGYEKCTEILAPPPT
jgi:membrane protease YdiL (CAAX protease family)